MGAQKNPVKIVFFFQYIGPSAPLILVYFGQKFKTDITEPKIKILRLDQVLNLSHALMRETN